MDPESALLKAVEETLLLDLPVSPGECSVQWDGLPVPSMGQRYLAVSPGEVSSAGQEQNSLGLIYGVNVHVWLKLGVAPGDVNDFQMLNAGQMNDVCYRVARLLHLNYDTASRATVLSRQPATTDSFKFVEPLRFQGISAPAMSQDGDFGVKGSSMGRVIRFSGARAA